MITDIGLPDLAAGTARGCWFMPEASHDAACYGNAFHVLVGILGSCGEHGGAFRAKPGREGGVLLVGALHYLSVAHAYGRTHVEVGIGGVGTLHGVDSLERKFPVLIVQFLEGSVFLVSYVQVFF